MVRALSPTDMSRRKSRPKSPRRLRMNRHARLRSARAWLAAQRGRTPAQIGASYRKWYGVDWPCAIRELTQLGVVFDPGWVARLMSSLEGHVRARAARRTARRRQPAAHFPEDADAHFAYVAGYTANGVPFGVTWEEWDRLNAGAAVSREEPHPF